MNIKTIILDATDGGKQIFIEQLGYSEEAFSKKKKIKDRPEEHDASASFTKKNGVWLFKDFGTSEKATDAIGLYARKYNMDYAQAQHQLAKLYGVESPKYTATQIRREVAKAPEGIKPSQFGFNLKKTFSPSELAFLGPDVTQQICDDLHYKSVASMWWVSDEGQMTTIWSDPYNMIFCRECRQPGHKEGDTLLYKVYQPHGGRFKFSYRPAGMEPGSFVHGLYELANAYKAYNEQKRKEWCNEGNDAHKYKEQKLREAIICSGERDALCVRARGYWPIWLNSETATMTQQIIDAIKQYAYRIYYIPDCDGTGLRQGRHNAFTFSELYTVWLPADELCKKTGDQQKPMKDLRDWCSLHRKAADFKLLLSRARPMQFWSYNEKGVRVHSDYLFYFLSMNGFYRQKNQRTKEYDLFHIKDYGIDTDKYIVESIRPEDIRSFLIRWVDKQGVSVMVRDAIFDSKQTKTSALIDLCEKEFCFKNCTINSQDFFAQNAAFRVTADGISVIDKSTMSNYVLSDKVFMHDVTLTQPYFCFEKAENRFDGSPFYNANMTEEGMDCKFARIIFRQCELYWRKMYEEHKELTDKEEYECQKALQNALFMLGFIFHRYKNPTHQWMVIRIDWKVGKTSDEKNGRDGKSIITQIMRKIGPLNVAVVKVNKRDALEYTHAFGSVTPWTDVVNLDEIPQAFDYDKLNDETSLGMNVNRKHHDEVFYPFEESPKLVGSTNYVPTNLSQSAQGRYLINPVSDYYHERTADNDYKETRKIHDEFNRVLWDENYSEDDWNKDYNFIMQCERFYLYVLSDINDKLEPPMSNIIKRINQSQEDDYVNEWMEQYFGNPSHCNTKLPKIGVVNDYNTDNPRHQLTEKQLKKCIKAYCASHEHLEFNPIDVCNDKQARRIRNNNNIEYFYIRRV